MIGFRASPEGLRDLCAIAISVADFLIRDPADFGAEAEHLGFFGHSLRKVEEGGFKLCVLPTNHNVIPAWGAIIGHIFFDQQGSAGRADKQLDEIGWPRLGVGLEVPDIHGAGNPDVIWQIPIPVPTHHLIERAGFVLIVLDPVGPGHKAHGEFTPFPNLLALQAYPRLGGLRGTTRQSQQATQGGPPANPDLGLANG